MAAVGSSPAVGTGGSNGSYGGGARGRAGTKGSAAGSLHSQGGLGVGTPALSESGLSGIVNGTGGLNGLGIATGGSSDGVAGVGGAVISARDNEEERQRRMLAIVELLGKRWGRVSQESVERCARRLELECLWEDGAQEQRVRTLSIAGHGLLIDVEFAGVRVRDVSLSFPGSGDAAGRSTREGAELLKKDLTTGGEGSYTLLDPFAKSLEKLARLDRLGRAGVSCFDAIEGIHGCMKRVNTWEVARLREKRKGTDEDEEDFKREVLCKQTGQPSMHASGAIGLRLEYWLERRYVRRKKRKADEMDADGVNSAEPRPKLWTAAIDCEASSAELYPSIRTSDAWVTETVEKPTSVDDDLFSSTEPAIDWQEPPPTLISVPEPQGDAMNIDSNTMLQSKSADVRFIARLQPPVIVPLQTAIEIYNLVGAPLAQNAIQSTTYSNLLFPESMPLRKACQQCSVERTTTSYSTSNPHGTPKAHKYTFFGQKHDFARIIHDIPFSHPRHLAMIVPTLRQWALVEGILKRTLTANTSVTTSLRSNGIASTTKRAQPSSKPRPYSKRPKADDFDALLADESDSTVYTDTEDEESEEHTTAEPLPLDISLTLAPTPRITVIWPFSGASDSSNNTISSIAFQINSNGEIEAFDTTSQSEVKTSSSNMEQKDGGKQEEDCEKMMDEVKEIRDGSNNEDAKGVRNHHNQIPRSNIDLARALAIAEDLGVVVEWMDRSRLRSTSRSNIP